VWCDTSITFVQLQVWNWEDTAELKRATAGVNLKIWDVLVERAKDCLQLYRNG